MKNHSCLRRKVIPQRPRQTAICTEAFALRLTLRCRYIRALCFSTRLNTRKPEMPLRSILLFQSVFIFRYGNTANLSPRGLANKPGSAARHRAAITSGCAPRSFRAKPSHFASPPRVLAPSLFCYRRRSQHPEHPRLACSIRRTPPLAVSALQRIGAHCPVTIQHSYGRPACGSTACVISCFNIYIPEHKKRRIYKICLCAYHPCRILSRIF